MKTQERTGITTIALALLAAGLLITAGTVVYYRQSLSSDRDERFQRFVDRSAAEIQSRIETYERGVRGTRGAMLAAGPTRMTLEQFRLVHQSRDPDMEFPGLRGFSFVQRVAPDAEAQFLAEAAAQGRRNIRIRQLAPHDGDRYVVKYLEPEDSNRAAIGLDIGSEQIRRNAMVQALETGRATLTRPITLVQADGKSGRGFLLMLGVYPSYPLPPSGPERYAFAVGAINAPLVIDEILSSINPAQQGVSLTLTDVDRSYGDSVFYGESTASSPARPLTASRRMEVFGRTWRADFQAEQQFFDSLPGDVSAGIAATGIAVTLLLSLLFHREARSRRVLEATSERLHALIRNAPTALAMFDQDMRYLAVSERWLDMYSLRERDILGVSHYELFPHLPEEWKEVHRRALAGEELQRENDHYERPDGSTMWLHWAIRPWHDPSGDIAGVIIFSEDVTERHQMTAAIEASKLAAEVANRAKTLFLGNMSHEMKTPLHQIFGAHELLRRDAPTEKQLRRLDIMKAAMNRLDTIISSILTLVDLESKNASLQIVALNLNELIANVVANNDARAREKGLHIVTLADPVPDRLRGDARHLSTILACYINNAITFSDHGTLSITTSCIGEDNDSVRVRVAVRDEGIGIPAEKLAQIFEPFEQVDNSHTRAFGGTGVGLAIVRRLAQLMGGECGCESEAGKGSTFWITVPLIKEAALPGASVTASA